MGNSHHVIPRILAYQLEVARMETTDSLEVVVSSFMLAMNLACKHHPIHRRVIH